MGAFSLIVVINLLNSLIMGRVFGRLAHMRHIIMYQLAPNEQNIWKNFLMDGAQNTLRRVLYKADVIGIPLGSALLIYIWGNAEHARLQRKNPKDYENEE